MKCISNVNNANVFSVRLSPEVFLKRPATDNYWRLDEILKRKAVGILSVLFYSFMQIK